MMELKHNIKQLSISYSEGYTIRAVAMIMIIFVHCANEYDFYTSTISRGLLVPYFGYLGCAVFFFMSGYGLYCSYHKNKYNSNKEFGYKLISQIKTLLIPYLVAFAVTYLLSCSIGQTNDFTYLFSISMPDGNPIWFFKITLMNYAVCTLAQVGRMNEKATILTLFVAQFAIVCCLYLCKMPPHWYASNLAFVLGWYYACKNRYSRLVTPFALAIICIFSACAIMNINNAPMFIIGSLSFCVLLVTTLCSFTYRSKRLEFIGKNSLFFYLFDIPIMNAIHSDSMSCIAYFALNLSLTAVATYFYIVLKSKLFK